MTIRYRQTMHKLRSDIRRSCRVCGAVAYSPCIESVRDKVDRGYAEFKLLSAVHDLREIDPDHILVKAVELVLDPDNELDESAGYQLSLRLK